MLRDAVVLCFCVGVLAAPAWAAQESESSKRKDDNFPYRTVTTPEGLVFRVPEDMPIEKRGGILAPIPFDEYSYGKFKQIDVRLTAIDSRLERIEKMLEALKSAESSGPLRSS